ncbi:MAG: cyclic 2,3-diphosphoglycerate synthase [Candidatus Thermoplasmatota archaeon]|jgi:predicted GTPase|nr:cyclic 2,3-diphosphoglycerate synthase [Candidatus Thermoplasmatota archaeon]
MNKKKVIIMGAAGRDFHDFNTYFRDNDEYEVVGFTATQIPNIAGRLYPPALSGKLYPSGIKIYTEKELPELIDKFNIDEVVFSYSDVPHEYVMHKASIALANGAGFSFIPPKVTMLKSRVPVIAVCAVRTGCGKSQTTRAVSKILKGMGKRVVVIRHPMPYGNLSEQIVERFETYADLDKYRCTIEEREEFEPHLDNNVIVYAGVDYQKILESAEKEADIILWDGGNNDIPFFKPDLHIVVTDPLRAGHEISYHPGETNMRMADIIIINKVDSATRKDIETIRHNVKEANPDAIIIEARSPVTVSGSEQIKNKRVIVIEDGPTLTHGGMSTGAGIIATKQYGALQIMDPVPFSVGTISEVYRKYPHLINTGILPAMGYSQSQMNELQETINKMDADLVISGTPIDITRVIKVNKPVLRVRYELDNDTVSTLKNYLVNNLLNVTGKSTAMHQGI